jgi:Mn2+/Fe2+ NRAMP family transporter
MNEVSLKEWFSNLTRNQAGVVGCITGYFLGVISGPIIRLLLALSVLVMFGFLGRHLERKFESRLGTYGVIAAILAVTSMGPVKSWMGDVLADLFVHSSRFALAILCTYFLIQLHDRLRAPE